MTTDSLPGSRVTIVMYHYVRPIADSRWPRIKGLEVELFREQLAYLKRHYVMIGMEDLLASIAGDESLPPRACLLTFDDSYSDHYRHVFPILVKEGLSGAFYPPRATIRDRRLLDVNKIHFILANASDPGRIEASLDEALREMGGADEAGLGRLKAQYKVADHLDSAEVVYIKHLLQYALAEDVRQEIVHRLFTAYVSADETDFANELYMTEAEAGEMIEAGMHFGGHGDRHYWLSRLPNDRKTVEVERSKALLLDIGMAADRLTFCYPYGDHDPPSERILAQNGFRAAVTTRAAIADLAADSPLTLPRLDTIDLPRDAGASPNKWTLAA
ncbi:MAG TPA: polysaccharide deacetylase family protein [Allosphingosinicella sp.]|uniref:polysaccharide deacetylase family protein n=1 Tax=Allosphingosinicella sp. TaxID=2823234 RepID=UPI002EDAC2A7